MDLVNLAANLMITTANGYHLFLYRCCWLNNFSSGINFYYLLEVFDGITDIWERLLTVHQLQRKARPWINDSSIRTCTYLYLLHRRSYHKKLEGCLCIATYVISLADVSMTMVCWNYNL